MSCAVGEAAREDEADDEAVLASSERGECMRSGVEQRDVMRRPLVLRTTVGESEPDAVLAVDMGELTAKVGYCCCCCCCCLMMLSVGVSVDAEEAAEVDAGCEEVAGKDRSAARAANEASGVGGEVLM